MGVTFKYGHCPIKDIKVNTKTNGSKKKVEVESLEIDGLKILPSPRFWNSLGRRFRIDTRKTFKYFQPHEVFERISKVRSDDEIRYCIEEVTDCSPRMLAVSNPNSAYVPYQNLEEILHESNIDGKINYADGIVRSTHVPVQQGTFKIGPDEFANRFVLDTPIDGLGKPTFYLSLLRTVCVNGAVGYAPSFKTELTVGKKDDSIEFSMRRNLNSFNNEDGYLALQQRFESALNSWASVREVMKLSKILVKNHANKFLKVKKLVLGKKLLESENPVMDTFGDIIGSLNDDLGLANIDSLSEKRQRTVPTKVAVYDLLNISTEIATHLSTPAGGRLLQAYVGDLIEDEYDLEGFCNIYPDYKDMYVNHEGTAEALTSLHTLSN